jgi:hypothetical protein
MASAAAVALTGGLVADAFFGAPPAQAVTYQNGWDGKFSGDQLWLVADAGQSAPQWVADAQSATPADFSARLRPAYDPAGEADGKGCAAGWDSLATGPAEGTQGNSTLAQLGWDSQTGQAGLVVDASGNCYPVKDRDGVLEGATGGEFDPGTGDFYYVDRKSVV